MGLEAGGLDGNIKGGKIAAIIAKCKSSIKLKFDFCPYSFFKKVNILFPYGMLINNLPKIAIPC